MPKRAVPHDSAAGIDMGIEGEGGGAAAPAAAVAAMAARPAEALGRGAPGAEPAVASNAAGTFAQVARHFAGDPGHVHLLRASDKGPAVCHLRARPSAETREAIPAAMRLCAQELARQAAPETRPGAAAGLGQLPGAGPPSALQVAAYPENWAAVEGVYFWGTTGIGVGGMVVIAFKPLVLFRGGRYFEIDDAPLEDIDLAAEQRRRPRNWGRWRSDGSVYVLTDDEGRPHDHRLQDGNFFKAFAAEPATVLDKPYSRVSGGGNAAPGGETTVAVSTRMAFARDGSFTSGESVGAVQSGAQSGVGVTYGKRRQISQPGRYVLDRHTLTLTYPEGRTERRFFAFSSSHTPPRLSRDMLFIGDSGYTSDD